MHTKIALRYHLTTVKTATIKNPTTNVGGDVEREEPLFASGEMQINVALVEISLEIPQNGKSRTTT